jgi:hypothetical protein
MAHYSRERGWVSRPRRPCDTGPNPYDPSSNRFKERNRQTETELPGGLVRVDVGEPVRRLPGEGLRSRAVAAPEAVPLHSPPIVEPAPVEPARPVSPPRSRKEPWGLNRDER